MSTPPHLTSRLLMPPRWLQVTLADGRRCLLQAEPDPEAVLGMRDDFVVGAPPMRVHLVLDVDHVARTARRVVQFRQGWDTTLPPGLAPLVWAAAEANAAQP